MTTTVFAKWRIKDSEALRILSLLPELAEKTRAESGNVSYTIYQSESDLRELIIHEQYVDTAAAEAHRQSEHYRRIVVDEVIPYLEVREVVLVKKLI